MNTLRNELNELARSNMINLPEYNEAANLFSMLKAQAFEEAKKGELGMKFAYHSKNDISPYFEMLCKDANLYYRQEFMNTGLTYWTGYFISWA